MSAKKYSLGIVGRKAGMSRMFTEDGKSIPVTLIDKHNIGSYKGWTVK